jgi:hypothetical protein
VTPYNTSPLEDQRDVVGWLAQHRPRFVVVDRTTDSFDGIPHDVRIPVIFQHVIENYVYDHSVGPFDVLRRSPDQAPRQDAYWTRSLSRDADLGHVPDLMRYEIRSCEGGVECGAFLRLEASRGSSAGQVEVPIRFGRHKVVIRFQASYRRSEYTIPLARIWAWGLSRHPKLAGPPTPGWRAEILSGVQPRNILY